MHELRCVILRHQGVDPPHFDLMCERGPGGPLATWRSMEWPIVGPTELTPLRDHRRLYLDYEGEIAGDRGMVHRVDSGRCVWIGDGQVRLDVPIGPVVLTRETNEVWVADLKSEI